MAMESRPLSRTRPWRPTATRYSSSSASSTQPDSRPPTTTRWPSTPTVNAGGSVASGRLRKSGTGSWEFAASEQRVEGDAGRSQGIGAALFAINHAEGLDCHRAGLPYAPLRLQKCPAGGERVVHQHDSHSLAQLGTLDRASGAMCLHLFAHDERGQGALAGSAQRCHRSCNGVGAQREPAHSVDTQLTATLEGDCRHQVQTPSVEGHLLAVDVVVAAPATGQHEVPIRERALADKPAQPSTRTLVAHAGGLQRSTGWRAARTSSTRSTGVSWGAACTNARSRSASSTIAAQTAARSSMLRFDSVSVGSNIRASGTVVGKYTVGAYTP